MLAPKHQIAENTKVRNKIETNHLELKFNTPWKLVMIAN